MMETEEGEEEPNSKAPSPVSLFPPPPNQICLCSSHPPKQVALKVTGHNSSSSGYLKAFRSFAGRGVWVSLSTSQATSSPCKAAVVVVVETLEMDKKPGGREMRVAVVAAAVVFLGFVAFSCSVAAEFEKAKAEDMKLDGNLCSLPRAPAFGLGAAAMVCLSVAQIMGTSAAGSRMCSVGSKHGGGGDGSRNRAVAIVLLVLSWVSFSLAMVLLGTATSMNAGQRYGRGWLDGECYVVKSGVYLGAAALVAVTVVFILGFAVTATKAKIHGQSKGEVVGKTKSNVGVDAESAL